MLAAAVCLSSCDDKSDCSYTPGEPTAADCMKVYFDNSNPEDFIDEPGSRTSVDVKVSRVNATEAAEVPIICKSAEEGLTIPSSVKFEAGQTSATFSITFGQLETSKKYNFSLTLPEEYVDHYTVLDGATSYSSYIMDASWDTFIDKDTLYYTTGSTKNMWVTELQRLGNTNRYRVPDFLGSGLAFTFTVGDAASQKGYYKVEPTTNYYDYFDDYVKGFYFWDTANSQLASWTIGDKTVSELCIMKQYGTSDYTYISFQKGFGQIGTYYTTYADGSYDYYNYISMYFNPIED